MNIIVFILLKKNSFHFIKKIKYHVNYRKSSINLCCNYFTVLKCFMRSKELTFCFPGLIGLKSETEGSILACQNDVFNSSVYRSRVVSLVVKDTMFKAKSIRFQPICIGTMLFSMSCIIGCVTILELMKLRNDTRSCFHNGRRFNQYLSSR